jgi:hypothetical protein
MNSPKEVMDDEIIVEDPLDDNTWDDNKQHTEQMF